MMPVWLTHAAPRGAALTEQLAAMAPEIEWISLPSAQVNNLLLGQPLPALSDNNWLVLTSPSTVDALVQAWGPEPLLRYRLLVVGPGSAQQVVQYCPKARVLSPRQAPFDAQAAAALWHRAKEPTQGNQQTRVLVLGGQGSLTDWPALLATPDSTVEWQAAVNTVPTPITAIVVEAMRIQAQSGVTGQWVLTSRQAADWLLALWEAAVGPYQTMFLDQPAWAVHEAIAEHARRLGFSQIEVLEPGQPALISAVRTRPVAGI